MLEPSAVSPTGELVEEEVRRLIIRRHRHSAEVESVVGSDWAERLDPHIVLVAASPIENEIAQELEQVWLYPASGRSPYSGSNAKLFPWILAKAFLSSPAALLESVRERLRRLGWDRTPAKGREAAALESLRHLSERALVGESAKYTALLDHLRHIGVRPRSAKRAVVFAERIPTLRWLRGKISTDLRLDESQVAVLHGGLSDIEQQDIVESFKQESSPIRVLVTGDIASEGVNLHLQCHELIHFDIPWSLIRLEQRNGRIDRYGQRHCPRITTLLLDPDSEQFAGDVRILSRLVEKEYEAHRQLGDTASLMGKYDVAAEEEAIRQVLADERRLDDVVRTVDQVRQGTGIDAIIARLLDASAQTPASMEVVARTGAYPDDLSFVREALDEVMVTPGASPPSGVGWKEHAGHAVVELIPTTDLRQRLEVLPQSYLRDRRVTERFKLATSLPRGKQELVAARADETTSSWPEAHYLAPLHPIIDWLSDRALATLGRNQVFAVRADVEDPSMLLHGTLSNERGQMVASSFLIAAFPNPANPRFALAEAFGSAAEALEAIGFARDHVNTGAPDPERLSEFVGPAVRAGRQTLETVVGSAQAQTHDRIRRWLDRVTRWDFDADALVQRAALRDRRHQVEQERDLSRAMQPHRQLVRPLLLVVPRDWRSPAAAVRRGTDA